MVVASRLTAIFTRRCSVMRSCRCSACVSRTFCMVRSHSRCIHQRNDISREWIRTSQKKKKLKIKWVEYEATVLAADGWTRHRETVARVCAYPFAQTHNRPAHHRHPAHSVILLTLLYAARSLWSACAAAFVAVCPPPLHNVAFHLCTRPIPRTHTQRLQSV